MIFRLIRRVVFGFIFQVLGFFLAIGMIVYFTFFNKYHPLETLSGWWQDFRQSKVEININRSGQETELSIDQKNNSVKLETKKISQ